MSNEQDNSQNGGDSTQQGGAPSSAEQQQQTSGSSEEQAAAAAAAGDGSQQQQQQQQGAEGSASAGDANAGGDPNNDGNDDGEEPSLEWSQTRTAAQPAAAPGTGAGSEDGKDAELTSLRKQVEELTALKQQYESELEQLRPLRDLENDAVIVSYRAFKLANPSADTAKYLQQLGAISVQKETDEDELLTAYYTQRAKKAFTDQAEIDEAVAEKIAEFESLGKLERKERLIEIQNEMGVNRSKSVEEWANELQGKAKESMKESALYAKRQYDNFTSYLTKAAQSGVKINGVKINEEQVNACLDFIANSPLMMDPKFVVLADPDANGVQDYYVPDMIKKVHAALFIDQINQVYQSRIASSRTENLEERARAAERARASAETKGMTDKEKADLEYKNALAEDKKMRGIPVS